MSSVDEKNFLPSTPSSIINNNFIPPKSPIRNDEEDSTELTLQDDNVVVSTRSTRGEVLFIGDGPTTVDPMTAKASGGGSLQDNFKKFREQKMRERQLQKLCQQAVAQHSTAILEAGIKDQDGSNLTTCTGRSQEFKDQLRNKFVETAKRYIGVPYALRFKDPDAPVAPLYLDCCGLVRRVMSDLAEEFGFVMGKWNQAYQMDTLPIVVEKVEDLRPGDLIFYEGEFLSNRSKPQKHNNVHVEIFLGGETGEATIGSRFQRGNVSIFPSYKFESKNWSLIRHHFRSIDTWLDGVCKSWCPEHPWKVDESLCYVVAAGKRSIFSEENDDVGVEDDDESAGGEDFEEDQVLTNEENGVLDSDEEGGGDGSDYESSKSSSALTAAAKVKRRSQYSSKLNLSVPARSDNSTSAFNKNLPRCYYVNKSNGWRLVKAAMDRMGWQQLPFDYNFSNRYGLKWVERRSQIDYRSHLPGQLVCHIPNSDCLTTKIGLLMTLKDHFCSRTNLLMSSAAKLESANISSETKESTKSCNHPPWLPETYDLETPAEVYSLMKAAEESDVLLAQDSSRNGLLSVWIYKPSSNNRGRGIRLLTGASAVKALCYGLDDSSQNTAVADPQATAARTRSITYGTNATPKGIVQRYIERPLLVMPRRLKFDIRCYLLIARTFPTTLAFYHPGYTRLTLQPYELSLNTIDDSMIHLTNASIQKKGTEYASNKSTQIQSIEDIARQCEEAGNISSAEYLRKNLDSEIKQCMMDLMAASNSKLLKRHGYFDMLGCDFMITESNELVLLEVNTNPALSLDNDLLANLLPGVVDGALQIVIRTQGPGADLTNPSLDDLPGSFELIFQEK